ncbi:Lrp/AsnC family transcriptional regulator [Dactylosporangium salmoneum]|uniref:Lrp/AsnC family transcriptional regulator n=2 Tax=Dactylosporangium salmoneum TaxID=53361 RepID=A0ABN3H917_9ACTN
MAELDETDRRIVDKLRGNSRMSMRALAAALHISRANVYTRVARLERDGVITGYTAIIDPQRYGHALSAYVYLKVQQQSWKRLQDRLLSIPEVDHAALVSGEHDIVLLVRTRDTAALRDLVLTRLQEMPEVLSTQTDLIFDETTPAARLVGTSAD